MALSRKKTCLAVLRQLTNYDAPGFGELIGRKVDWMKKAESGKIPVPVEVSRMISHETGVSLDWILKGDAHKPCVDWKGEPYTLASWNAYRAKLGKGRPDQLRGCNPCAFLPEIFAIAEAAGEKFQMELFTRDLDACLNKLKARYGWNKAAGEGCFAHMEKNREAFTCAVTEGDFPEEDRAFLMDAPAGQWTKTFSVAHKPEPAKPAARRKVKRP
jgi:hypothetical protein